MPDEVIAVYQEASVEICIFLTVALSFDQASPKLCILSISQPWNENSSREKLDGDIRITDRMICSIVICNERILCVGANSAKSPVKKAWTL